MDAPRGQELELPLDQIVPEYASGNPLIRRLFHARLDTATALAPWRGAPVLDAGCGSGELLRRLATGVPAAQLHGVDLNENVSELGDALDWTIQRADIHALPYPDGFFETIHCLDILEHIDDLRPVLRELRRVLRPDGQLIVSIPMENAFYRLGRLLLKGTTAMDQGPAAGVHYWTGAQLRDALRADFELEETRCLPLGGPFTLFEVVRLRNRPLPVVEPGTRFSVVIPAYDEARTVVPLLERVLAAPTLGLEREVIVVDDGSRDDTAALAESVPGVTVLRQERNRGKGAALRAGFARASGEFVIVQDADLEYDPGDYARLLEPLIDGRSRVVYGSRSLGRDRATHSSWSFFFGGQLVTVAANRLFGLRLSDEPTCYKAFRRELLPDLELECEGFEFCSEITAKLARQGIAILEVPIAYRPRTRAAGKKIGWSDGVEALRTLWRYRRWSPRDRAASRS